MDAMRQLPQQCSWCSFSSNSQIRVRICTSTNLHELVLFGVEMCPASLAEANHCCSELAHIMGEGPVSVTCLTAVIIQQCRNVVSTQIPDIPYRKLDGYTPVHTELKYGILI